MMKNMRKGIPKLFKDGYKQFSGVEEAILNNTAAIKQFAEILRTSFGPNGMNKVIINHIEKVYVTSDAASIVSELEVEHPAANVVVQAAGMQQKEIGDGSNLVVVLAGELMKKAEELIGMGLHPSDIVQGYDKAINKCLDYLSAMAVKRAEIDFYNADDLAQAVRTSAASKFFGMEDYISKLVGEACAKVMPENPLDFQVDNVRTFQILGSNLYDSKVVNGLLFYGLNRGHVKKVENCKVLIMNTSIGLREMDATQNVLFENASDLLNFAKSEENLVEASIKRIHDMGVRLLMTGGKCSDLEYHYINKYNIMHVPCISKFQRRRMARMTKSRICVTKDFGPEDLGFIKCAEEVEIGGKRLTSFQQADGESACATIVIRGASDQIMDDFRRACTDGINTVRAMCRESDFVPGAGATEIELSRLIQDYGSKVSGLDQYAVKAYGEALEVVPRTLAANSGMDFEDTIAKLYAAHSEGKTSVGVDIVNKSTLDAVENGILDLLVTKKFAMRLATNSALTILRVDHIIMSKPAGGPKKPNRQGHWDDDDDAW